MSLEREAIDYHQDPPGKLGVAITKPVSTQKHLSLAYSPGVAAPCLEIEKDQEKVYQYTAKGNLVAVISNGTAVLGLGNIGPKASKPVMEGKAVLFKRFAAIDSFDIEIDETDPTKFVEVVKAIAPTFGGINLEDIKAPECFEIEDALREQLDIPIMHDDQHGTAIITAAGILNALSIVNKSIEAVQFVINGAGAGGIACAKLLEALGAQKHNIIMLDSKGVITQSRTNLHPTKRAYATSRNLSSLEEACVDADVFIGLSKADVFTPEHLLSMTENPIVFALSNPNPEIAYDLAMKTREDLIIGTGRSDYPNQVNNVLGFPFIFRGALDVHAKEINEAMKMAAVRALADLAKEPVPDIVKQGYPDADADEFTFGKKYLLPKPTDPRLIVDVSLAVAKAAVESGVARKPVQDWDEYCTQLMNR